MALDMNAEIRDQNEQMDRIAEKVKQKQKDIFQMKKDNLKIFDRKIRLMILKFQAASDQGQVARANQAAAEILKQWKFKKKS